MNHNDEELQKNLRKFSVVKQCPKCGKLSLSFSEGRLSCSSCGYNEDIPMAR